MQPIFQQAATETKGRYVSPSAAAPAALMSPELQVSGWSHQAGLTSSRPDQPLHYMSSLGVYLLLFLLLLMLLLL